MNFFDDLRARMGGEERQKRWGGGRGRPQRPVRLVRGVVLLGRQS